MYSLSNKRVLVTGGGGFIGGWLVKRLTSSGCAAIRSVDIKAIADWHTLPDNIENMELDLSRADHCDIATKDCDVVFNLAADMGGMGFIENNKALCMLSVLINTHLLQSARNAGVERFFFASSACVYRADLQNSTSTPGLKEADAYPASPEDGYGWEKLFSERMCRHFSEDFKLQTRVARYHNVYGPFGTFDGGREKAPAAICRKVADAIISNSKEILIWGDGNQTRSFCYVDDMIDGIIKMMYSNEIGPINLGNPYTEFNMIELKEILEKITDKHQEIIYLPLPENDPKQRKPDISIAKERLTWEPVISIETGLLKTISHFNHYIV